MKKTLKKITAVVMATATMAIGIGGLSASAVGGTQSFSPSSTAALEVYSSQVNASTRCTGASYLLVQITNTYGASITSGQSYNAGYNISSVSCNGKGNGFTGARSYHSSTKNGTSGNTSMTVYR